MNTMLYSRIYSICALYIDNEIICGTSAMMQGHRFRRCKSTKYETERDSSGGFLCFLSPNLSDTILDGRPVDWEHF
jgi:hypothetical protein